MRARSTLHVQDPNGRAARVAQIAARRVPSQCGGLGGVRRAGATRALVRRLIPADLWLLDEVQQTTRDSFIQVLLESSTFHSAKVGQRTTSIPARVGG